MKFKKTFLLILLTTIALTGCANQNKAENSSSKSIALITDGSGINDILLISPHGKALKVMV